MFSLTPCQIRVLRFVQGWIEATGGIAPTFAEMSFWLGMNKSSVHKHLGSLAERGYIRRLLHRKQAIEITRPVDLARGPDGAPLFVVPMKPNHFHQPIFLS